MADALRGSMDAAEYKHVVLGLCLHLTISCVAIANAVVAGHQQSKSSRSGRWP
ncbi:MAG: hypothetical protein OXI83_02670 [Gemmatimonadota bacterium]|nr:hypothetical protein [Gemmatimonadota bacterium]